MDLAYTWLRIGAGLGCLRLRVVSRRPGQRPLSACRPGGRECLEHGEGLGTGRRQVPEVRAGLNQELGGRCQQDQPPSSTGRPTAAAPETGGTPASLTHLVTREREVTIRAKSGPNRAHTTPRRSVSFITP